MTRGDAITILDCERPYGSCGCGATDEEIEEALNMAIEALEQEPKTGHWIGGYGHYICSCCRYNPLRFLEPLGLDGGFYMAIPMKYCPNCGAKMSEGSEK